MRARLFQIVLILFPSISFSQKIQPIIDVGINYRDYPIDLEDVIIYYPEKGGFYGDKFWRTWSLMSRAGINMKKNLQFSFEADVRYNQLHWVRGDRYTTVNYGYFPSQDREYTRNFKYDLFLNVEKKFRLHKVKESYLFVLGGIGYTNINSHYDVVLQDTADNVIRDPVHYEGSVLHLSPRLSIGYQFWRCRVSLDGYIIEDPQMRNLTSLWLGGTLSYEFWPRKKKANAVSKTK